MGSEAVVEALQAFTSIVTATLGDAHAQAAAEAEQAQAELSPQEALSALSMLALRQQGLATASADVQQGEQAVSFCTLKVVSTVRGHQNLCCCCQARGARNAAVQWVYQSICLAVSTAVG